VKTNHSCLRVICHRFTGDFSFFNSLQILLRVRLDPLNWTELNWIPETNLFDRPLEMNCRVRPISTLRNVNSLPFPPQNPRNDQKSCPTQLNMSRCRPHHPAARLASATILDSGYCFPSSPLLLSAALELRGEQRPRWGARGIQDPSWWASARAGREQHCHDSAHHRFSLRRFLRPWCGHCKHLALQVTDLTHLSSTACVPHCCFIGVE
jgi:hypothetical protein